MEVENGVGDLVSCAGVVEAPLFPMMTSRSVLCSSWLADMVVLGRARSMVEAMATCCDVDLTVSAILKSPIVLEISRISMSRESGMVLCKTVSMSGLGYIVEYFEIEN